jgi:hypothetical protein
LVRKLPFFFPDAGSVSSGSKGTPELVCQEEVLWEGLTGLQIVAHGAIEVLYDVSGSHTNHLSCHSRGRGSEEAKEDQEDEMKKMHLGCGKGWSLKSTLVSTRRGNWVTKVVALGLDAWRGSCLSLREMVATVQILSISN